MARPGSKDEVMLRTYYVRRWADKLEKDSQGREEGHTHSQEEKTVCPENPSVSGLSRELSVV